MRAKYVALRILTLQEPGRDSIEETKKEHRERGGDIVGAVLGKP